MLLNESTWEDFDAAVFIPALPDAPHERGQHLEILGYGALGAVGVMPNHRVRCVNRAHLVDLTTLDRIEEPRGYPLTLARCSHDLSPLQQSNDQQLKRRLLLLQDRGRGL